MVDKPLTPVELADAAQRVLVPELDGRPLAIPALKVTLQLRPLPLKLARQISKAVAKLQEETKNSLTPGDETLDMFLMVGSTMLKFYGYDLSKEQIEESIHTDFLLSMLEQQIEVNGQNDFLLAPLRIIIGLSRQIGPQMEEQMFRSSRSLPPSVKPGGRISTNS